MSKRSKSSDNYDESWAKKQRKKLQAGKSNKSQRGKVSNKLREFEKKYT